MMARGEAANTDYLFCEKNGAQGIDAKVKRSVKKCAQKSETIFGHLVS